MKLPAQTTMHEIKGSLSADIDVAMIKSLRETMPAIEAMPRIFEYVRVLAHNAHAGHPDTPATRQSIVDLRQRYIDQLIALDLYQKRPI